MKVWDCQRDSSPVNPAGDFGENPQKHMRVGAALVKSTVHI